MARLYYYRIALIVFLFVGFHGSHCYAQHLSVPVDNPVLIRISEGQLFGFIDTTGRVAVPCIFRALFQFSEGYAAARKDGLYGFIDGSGAWAIAPQFDFVGAFHDGIAIAYLDGLPFYINKAGQRLFPDRYTEVHPFRCGRAVVYDGEKCGVINTQGELIVPFAHGHITDFRNGLAIRNIYNAKGSSLMSTNLIDTNGKQLFPEGKYDRIFFKGDKMYYFLSVFSGDTSYTEFVDSNGNYLSERPTESEWLTPALKKVRLQRRDIFQEFSHFGRNDSWVEYEAVADTQGKLVVNDSVCLRVVSVLGRRVVLQDSLYRYYMRDMNGNRVGTKYYREIVELCGAGSYYAFAAIGDTILKWGIIDTNGNYTVSPQYSDVSAGNFCEDGVFLYAQTDSMYNSRWWMATLDGEILSDTMDFVSNNGFRHGLLYCEIRGRSSYINTRGQVVWHESVATRGREDRNIDYMACAYHRPIPSGYVTNNIDLSKYKKQKGAKRLFRAADTAIKVDVLYNQSGEWSAGFSGHVFNGIPVVLFNGTGKNAKFLTIGSSFLMIVEARDPKGVWRAVEYWPIGGSMARYQDVIIKKQDYYVTIVPAYSGTFKTRMRVAVGYYEQTRGADKKYIQVTSNEYEGSVNPSQFWRKAEDYPQRMFIDEYNTP